MQLCVPEREQEKTSMAAPGKHRNHRALRAAHGSESHGRSKQNPGERQNVRKGEPATSETSFLSPPRACLLKCFGAQPLEGLMFSATTGATLYHCNLPPLGTRQGRTWVVLRIKHTKFQVSLFRQYIMFYRP